jgi:hypothetical protein
VNVRGLSPRATQLWLRGDERQHAARIVHQDSPAGHFLVKRITNAGTFRFQHKLRFIANVLKQHHIGLEDTGDGIWSSFFGTVLLTKVDEREMIIRD